MKTLCTFAIMIFLTGVSMPLRADDADAPPLISSDGHKITSLDEQDDAWDCPMLSFFVRYPQGLSPHDKVQGILDYVTHLTQKKSLSDWIKQPSSDDVLFQFADRHQFAVVTWTTATIYSTLDSFNKDPDEERNPYNSMEESSRAWKRGTARLCHDYGLPESGYLIYGYSRGAEWAHRIVLRNPEKFLAVHIHVNSTFEEPVPEASHCLWLLTTGELEYGCAAAKIFYQKALALNYPILLRIYPGKAHEVFPEEEQLGVAFFEYVLKLRDAQIKLSAGNLDSDPLADPPPFVLDDSLLAVFQRPAYYADPLNGDVYPANQMAFVPETNRVAIPDIGIAKVWGYLHPETSWTLSKRD